MTRTRSAGLSGRSVALLALGAASLLAGLTGALALLGVSVPTATVRLAGTHGLLMTLGFLGTLIALERAVALGRWWGYLAPLAAGLGGAALVAGLPVTIAGVFLSIGAGAYVVLYVAFDRIERSLHTSVQAVGALAWLGAAILIVAGRPISAAVPWLAAFLVLTIAGERLELSRLVRTSHRAIVAFVGIIATLAGGVLLTLVAPDAGIRVAGAGLVSLAGWLARNDIARRTVRTPGVTRFVAVALLTGYAWLAVAGACWLAFGAMAAGPGYDTALHALFLGFVISMVFGHAPVILPAVLRLSLPYHPAFYGHLGLLHVGLLVRIVLGDALGSEAAWRAGGILNVAAMLLFVASSAVAAVAGQRARAHAAARGTRRSTWVETRS